LSSMHEGLYTHESLCTACQVLRHAIRIHFGVAFYIVVLTR
jgi:hypothetical protein